MGGLIVNPVVGQQGFKKLIMEKNNEKIELIGGHGSKPTAHGMQLACKLDNTTTSSTGFPVPIVIGQA